MHGQKVEINSYSPAVGEWPITARKLHVAGFGQLFGTKLINFIL